MKETFLSVGSETNGKGKAIWRPALDDISGDLVTRWKTIAVESALRGEVSSCLQPLSCCWTLGVLSNGGMCLIRVLRCFVTAKVFIFILVWDETFFFALFTPTGSGWSDVTRLHTAANHRSWISGLHELTTWNKNGLDADPATRRLWSKHKPCFIHLTIHFIHSPLNLWCVFIYINKLSCSNVTEINGKSKTHWIYGNCDSLTTVSISGFHTPRWQNATAPGEKRSGGNVQVIMHLDSPTFLSP